MPEPQSIPLRHDVVDLPELWPVEARGLIGAGRPFSFFTDRVRTPSGETMRRDFLDHTGAVAILAVDEAENVVVVHQYRHPAGYRLIEPPAGLLDAEGEDPWAAARRELAEEAGLAARDWACLVDLFTTPGGVSESIRVYLARGLSATPAPPGFVVEHEEAHMDLWRVPVDVLAQGILAGRLQSPTLLAGVLAYLAVRGSKHALRPPDAPWPARDQLAALRSAAPDAGRD